MCGNVCVHSNDNANVDSVVVTSIVANCLWAPDLRLFGLGLSPLAAVGVAASGVAAAVEVVAVASEEGAVSEVAKFGRGGSFWFEKNAARPSWISILFLFLCSTFFQKRFLYTKKNSCFEIHQMNQSLFLLVL